MFKSRSTNEWYKTERHRNGNITCFCPGFVYSKAKGEGKCWHTEQAKHWKK